MEFIKKWNPKQVYFVHFSDEDRIPGDPYNDAKLEFEDPLPYNVPKTHQGWDHIVRAVFRGDQALERFADQPNIIAYDGLKIPHNP